MTRRRPRPPLTHETLSELALTYVGRFATTRMKLARYLSNKIRERGWDGSSAPEIDAIVERCVRNGFIDDAAFALSKARSLGIRGYGAMRVRQSLRAAGVGEEDSRPAETAARQDAVNSALRLAKRKRVGPFSADPLSRDQREKALAAMIRGGHGFALSQAIVSLAPGEQPDLSSLAEAAGHQID